MFVEEECQRGSLVLIRRCYLHTDAPTPLDRQNQVYPAAAFDQHPVPVSGFTVPLMRCLHWESDGGVSVSAVVPCDFIGSHDWL